MYCKQAVIGPFSGKEFAKEGDEVLLISVHDNVAIVEKNKVRFTAKLSELSEDPNPREPTKENNPAVIAQNEVQHPSATTKTRKAKPAKTKPSPSLF